MSPPAGRLDSIRDRWQKIKEAKPGQIIYMDESIFVHEQWAADVEFLFAALDEAYQRGREKGIDEAAKMLELSVPDILLLCGEMSAQEMRSVKAILVNRCSQILSLKTSGKEGAK